VQPIRPGSLPTEAVIYSVTCTDANDYIDWQCELLEYSWERAGQPGELIRLVTCPEGAALPDHKHTRVVHIGTSLDRTGGYLAFERLFALQDWLRLERPEGSVLILDPDCVFRRSVTEEVEPGSPRAQHWIDFPGEHTAQAATWPALIHTHDLETLLPRWIESTGAIRAATGRWESDMFGLVTAAANSGLRFTLDTIAAFVKWPDEVVGKAPIVHYCQDVLAMDGDVLWSKRSYQPWEAVVAPETAQHVYCRELLMILNECAQQRRGAARL
jgi:hypothetical protein